tara:strand:+ start:919 stop:1833 length:915 start_codon:yes stop_codon:yes gene_type:complete
MTNIQNIARRIRSGEYPRVDVDVDLFFDEHGNPLRDTRIQVRDQDRDIDRIDRAVDKMEASGDVSKLEDLTLISFPFADEKLLNGSHTAEMRYLLRQRGKIDVESAKGCIVDFERDLGGKLSNALALGNALNEIEVEKGDVQDNDIRKHLFQILDEKLEDGLEPKLTDLEKDEFIKLYPRISRATIGQWISYREDVGGRRDPLITYTAGELQTQKIALENLTQYKDYVILEPRTLSAALETGVEQAFRRMREFEKRKCLVVLYCKTRAMQDSWENGQEEKIQDEYLSLSEYWGATIEYQMLRYE